MAAHKISRGWSEHRCTAGCVCGWAARHERSALVSLAVAAHRNAHGLNPRLAAAA